MLDAIVLGTIAKSRNITSVIVLLAIQITVLVLMSLLLIGLLHPLHAQTGNTSSTGMIFHTLKDRYSQIWGIVSIGTLDHII